MPGERFHLVNGVWQRVGWASVLPGELPTDPSLPPPPPQAPRLRIIDLTLQGTGTPTGPPDPLPSGTFFGACPENPGGESLADATRVVTKWGPRASIRQFHGNSFVSRHPAGCSVVHSSYRPSSDAAVNSGSYDTIFEALIASTPDGDILECDHESDNDGLSAAARTERIRAKNRLYEIKQVVKPGVLVAHTHTGGMWASYGSDATRDAWMLTAKGDLIGVDCDGVHDTSGPTVGISYTDEVANAKRYLAKSAVRGNGFIGWLVPENGTSRQPWDNGSARADWFEEQCAMFADEGAYAVMAYDFNTSAHNLANNYNRVLPGTPEYTIWRNLVASNPS